MRFIFCIFLSVIGLVSFGETSKKLENGIYHNETSSKLIEIKNDTLKFYSSSSIEGEQSFPLAICQITKVSDTFFEINSIEGPMQSAFKNILIIEEVSGNKTLAEILFKVPNTTMPIKFNVYCGTISYSGITEKGTCTIVIELILQKVSDLHCNQCIIPKVIPQANTLVSYTTSIRIKWI